MSRTVRAGVVGHPIDHSLSPLIHGAWIAALDLDAAYDRFGPGDQAGFDALVGRLRAGELRGLNVTAPYKERALALADQASDVARAAGSANLLVVENGRLSADSTDGRGMIAAIREQAPALDLTSGAAVVLGAGGAARAAIRALLDADAPEVRIVNRTRAKAEALAETFGPRARAAGSEALDGARLAVNAAAGADPPDLSGMVSNGAVMDMTYRPLMTPLLRAAVARGLTPVDGLAMLIGQARPSFERIFGAAAPVDVDVRALAMKAMGA